MFMYLFILIYILLIICVPPIQYSNLLDVYFNTESIFFLYFSELGLSLENYD